MDDFSVPPYFICPISLDMMKDPVTVPTGITYDRESIEKWLFSGKNTTCPVTKQVISYCELTPNHTLRRLIQTWCTINASNGVERIPTPKTTISKAQILQLFKESKSREKRVTCVRKLRSIASENDSNKFAMKAAGAVEFLVSIFVEEFESSPSGDEAGEDLCFESMIRPLGEEALSLLYMLQPSETIMRNIATGQYGEFIGNLGKIMRSGSYDARGNAVMMLKSLLEVSEPGKIFSLQQFVFVEVVDVIKDQISKQASKAAIQLLISLCPWGRNRIKTVEANAVGVLIDLLLDTTERRIAELALTLLDILCQCAEGRAEFLSHAAGIAVVSKKILRVSEVGSERAIRILSSISKFSATPAILHEMLQVGVVAKLCLILQVSCGSKMKERAKETLRLHAKAWKHSPCIPVNLAFSYPS